MNIRTKTLLPVLALGILQTASAQTSLLTYWNFNNLSLAYNAAILGSLKTSAATPTNFGEIYKQTGNSTPGTLSSNTSNSTVFNSAAIQMDFSNIATITTLPNGPTINGKRGPAYTTQEGTVGYAGYGTFAGSTTNVVGTDPAGDSLIFLNGSNTMNGKYITFSLSSLGYDTLSLSYATRLSMTASEIWTYSTDGTNFSPLSTQNYTTTSGAFITTTLDLSALSTNVLNNKSTFYLRLSFNSGSGNGSYSFDNLKLTGVATSAPSSAYLAWIDDYDVGGQTGPSDDPDDDGIDNGVEFVLKNGNPEVPNTTQVPVSSVNGNNLVFSFERDDRAKGSTVTVEAGSNLTTWPETYIIGADTASSTTPGVVINNDSDANPDTVTVTIPKDGAPAKFARLKVVEIP